MSAIYIIEYAGAPVRLGADNLPELVSAQKATQFPSEADAWHAAYRACLPPDHVEVVSLAVFIRVHPCSSVVKPS